MRKLLESQLKKGVFWTDSWSLTSGCTPCSPGCQHCWLASWSRRFEDGLVTDGHFNGTVRVHEERLDKPLRARRPRVYAVWSDLFHDAVPDTFLDRAFSVMAVSPRHHFIIVTKRPQRFAEYLLTVRRYEHPDGGVFFLGRNDLLISQRVWPLSNVTILGTVENQEMANLRVPDLLRISAMGWRVGVLAEPLLGPVDLVAAGGIWADMNDNIVDNRAYRGRLAWVLVGGETGPRARVAEVEWFRSLRDQAMAARIPFLLKSRGEWVDQYEGMDDCVGLQSYQEADPEHYFQCVEAASGALYFRVGKKHAGALLDGREHKEVPDVVC